jgi:hypothetical protein
VNTGRRTGLRTDRAAGSGIAWYIEPMAGTLPEGARKTNQDERYGMLARKMGFITREQLLEAIQMQLLLRRLLGQERSVAELLLTRGALTVEQFRKLNQEINAPLAETLRTRMGAAGLFGEVAVERGYARVEQVVHCLDLQLAELKSGRAPRPVGEIMVSQGMLTRSQLEEIQRVQDEG